MARTDKQLFDAGVIADPRVGPTVAWMKILANFSESPRPAAAPRRFNGFLGRAGEVETSRHQREWAVRSQVHPGAARFFPDRQIGMSSRTPPTNPYSRF